MAVLGFLVKSKVLSINTSIGAHVYWMNMEDMLWTKDQCMMVMLAVEPEHELNQYLHTVSLHMKNILNKGFLQHNLIGSNSSIPDSG